MFVMRPSVLDCSETAAEQRQPGAGGASHRTMSTVTISLGEAEAGFRSSGA